MIDIIIALGGNIGDVRGTFASVLRYLQDTGVLEKINMSRTYRSCSLLRDDQPNYYNCVFTARTSLLPQALLQKLKDAEYRFGRQNKGDKWQERTLDIDIIDYGSMVIREDNLFIPHSQMALRSFVLFPMREVAPDYIHPENGLTIEQMCDALKDCLEITAV